MSWLAQQTAVLDAAHGAAELAVNWLIQSTLLIAAGLTAGRLLQRRGSAVQSAMYRMTLLAAVVCPLASWVLSMSGFSGWSLAMPSAYTMAKASPMVPQLAAAPRPSATAAATVAKSPSTTMDSKGGPMMDGTAESTAVELQSGLDVSAFDDQASASLTSAAHAADESAAGVETAEARRATPIEQLEVHRFGVFAIVAGVLWAFAAAVQLARLHVAWRRLERIRRGASPAAIYTTEICSELARRMQIEPPTVLHSPYLPSPCLAGVLRPAIMLPDEDSEQQAQPVRDVLVHELAHLRRHDCLWNLMRRAATAILWFQPLLWLLSRRLDASAEEVCDDYVVQFGGDRQHYARRLVDIAELSATPFAAAGVAMVSIRSMLERRVTRIMDTSRSLSTRVGNVLLVLLLAGGAVGTIAAALVGLGAQVSEAQSDASDNGGEMKKSSNAADETNEMTAEELAAGDDHDEIASDEPPLQRHLTGRVVDENGKPIVGATVSVVRIYVVAAEPHLFKRSFRPITKATTSAAGDFELEFNGLDMAVAKDKQGWQLVASAPGYGPAWTDNNRLSKSSTTTFKLPLDQPISGRIVDMEGLPIAGVRIHVNALWTAESDQAVTDWIDQVKANPPPAFNDRDLWFSNNEPAFPRDWQYGKIENGMEGVPAAVVTDEDGRFELQNVGANRLALLALEGTSVATGLIPVVTRDTEVFEARPVESTGARSSTHYGRKFEFVAEPTQPVEGQVRDAENGEPISDLEVRLERFADNMMSQDGFISTRTDDMGRYRLTGLPSGGGHSIGVAPSIEQPYFSTEQKLAKVSSDPESIKCDFELRHGRWITGKVTEQESSDPIADAVVEYLPLRSNKHAAAYKNYDPKITGQVPSNRFHTDEKGKFRVLAIPGPGALGVIVERELQEEFAPLQPTDLPRHLVDDNGYLNAYQPWTITGYYALEEVDLADGEQPDKFHLECARGAARQVNFVDVDGEPVEGARILGRKFPPQFEDAITGFTTNVVGLRPGEERIVVALHEDRRIGRALKLAAGEPYSVELQPCAVARGRIVDEDGAPLANLGIGVHLEGPDTWARRLGELTTDADGHFELLLPSGLPLRVAHYSADIDISAECNPEPDAVFELGDLRDGDKLTAEQTAGMMQVAAAAAPSEKAKKRVAPSEFAGSVVTPDGQLAAEADIYLVYHIPEPTGLLTPSWKPVARTDLEGRFRFKLQADAPEYASLIAVKEGYGVAWSEAAFYETSGQLLNGLKAKAAEAVGVASEQFAERLKRAGQPLQLVVDGQPIRGRVVDINGQPVANVRLTLSEISASNDGDLTAWRVAVAEKQADYYSARMATPLVMNGPQVRSLVEPATTDANGRFTLRGVGESRIAELLVEGPGIETVKVLVRTEVGAPIVLERERRAPHLGSWTYHPAEFTHVAGPSTAIIGVVRDAKTNSPLAGVTVKSQSRHGEAINGWGQDFVRAVTDDEGRYELIGMPIGEENRIAAIAPDDKPYLSMSHEAATSADEDSLRIDFDLQGGVWIEGRATDQHTGEGLAGTLEYYVHRENPNYALTETMNVDERDRLQADKAGRFRIVALPGRGFVGFRADAHERYGRAMSITRPDGSQQAADEYMIQTGPSYLMPSNYHVVAEIDPAEGAERHELKLELDGGSTVTGRVVDADDKPVNGFYFSGRIAQFESWRPGKGDRFDVTGFDSKTLRDVYIAHPGRKLAGHIMLSGDPPQNLTVTLELAGTIRGRLVDASGEPLGHYVLHRWSSPMTNPGDFKHVRRAPPLPPSNEHTQVGEHETDADGRFEISCLAPRIEYQITAFHRDSMRLSGNRAPRPSGPLERVIVVEAGQTLDLGDVKIADREEVAAAQKQKEEGAAKQAAAAAATSEDRDRDELIVTDQKKSAAMKSGVKKAESAKLKPTTTKRGANGSATGKSASLRVHGQIRGPDRQPLAGVDVAVVSLPISVERGGGLSPRGFALFETKTNDDGRYELQLTGLSPETHRFTGLIARTEALALAWKRLDVSVAETEASFDLQPEAALTLQLVDIEGQPATGVEVNVAAVMPTIIDNRPPTDGAGFPNVDHAPDAWFDSITTDHDGRITIHNLAVSHGVALKVRSDDRFAPQDLAINTGMPEQRGERDATYRSQVVNNVKPGVTPTIPLSPAQVFTGVVRYEDTDEPAPEARLTIWASQQEFGSMMSVAGVADGEGRYRITPEPGIRFGVTAYPPDGAPYIARELEPVRWDAGDRSKEVNVTLPRGVLIRGRVIEADTDAPIAAASVQFVAEEAANKHIPKGAVTGWQDRQLTGDDGRFNIVVPPGPGRLLVHGPRNTYVIVETSSRELYEGRPGGERNYVHAVERIETAPNDHPFNVTLRLQPAETVAGELVDADGKPIESALMITRLSIHANWLDWHGHTSREVTAGRFELTGLTAGEEYNVHFLDQKRKLAAVATLRAEMDPPRIVLQPCGQATMRFVDPEGQPVRGVNSTIQLVVTSGPYQFDSEARKRGELAAAADFISNIDRLNHSGNEPTDSEGRLDVDALIPGATYRVVHGGNGDKFQTKDFVAKSGELVDVGELTLDVDN